MFYWLSWYQPTEDYRPLKDPPNPAILGWWCSGERADGAATLCACVIGENESHARNAVRIDWPEAQEWRFCKPVEEIGWRPSDRFPLVDWMRVRFAARDQQMRKETGR